MKILTIVGKVDTRVLAYPIARALSLNGLTAMITDDGAYRRLYHGEGLEGTVSGVDVSVGLKADEELKNSLNNTGIQYDNLVFISSGYVPAESTGVIICHGIDRSMLGANDTEEDEEKDEEKGSEASGGSEGSEGSAEAPVVKDKLVIPDGIPSVELQISYNSPSTKGLQAIMLKESFMNYIYTCEEKKELLVYPDKGYNKTLAGLLNTTLGIDTTEAFALLGREEYLKGTKNK